MVTKPIFSRFSRARTYLTGEGLGPLLVRSVAGSGVVRLIAMIASFAVGVQLARGLGATGYGYYGIALSVVTLVGIPAELGVSRVVTREVAAAASRGDLPHLFGVLRWADRAVLAISLVMMVALIAGASLFSETHPGGVGLAILFGAPMVPLMAIARLRGGALQGLHHIVRGQVPANVLRPIVLSLLIFSAFALGAAMNPPVAMALTSASAGAACLVAHLWLKQRLPESRPPRMVHNGRSWIASSIPMALTDGMQTLQGELCVLLLGLTSGATATGLFRIANLTAAAVATAGIVMVHVAMPIIARLHADGDRERLQRTVTALAWGQIGGVFLLSLPLLIAPGPLLNLAFGASYGPASDAVTILAIGQIANAAFGPTAALLNMTHNERRVTRAMIFAIAANVILLPPLAAALGTEGAAISLLVSLLIWNLITRRDAQQILGVETSILRSPMPLLHRNLR